MTSLLSLNNFLYETSPFFVGKKVNVRYDPDLLSGGPEENFLYEDDKFIGSAKKVLFADNALMKCRGRARVSEGIPGSKEVMPRPPSEMLPADSMPKNTIWLSAMDKEVMEP